MGDSPIKGAFKPQHISEMTAPNNDGLVDLIMYLLFTHYLTKPYSHEHILVHLLISAL